MLTAPSLVNRSDSVEQGQLSAVEAGYLQERMHGVAGVRSGGQGQGQPCFPSPAGGWKEQPSL